MVRRALRHEAEKEHADPAQGEQDREDDDNGQGAAGMSGKFRYVIGREGRGPSAVGHAAPS